MLLPWDEWSVHDEMSIPLTEVKKFNVKGKVLIYKKDGEVVELSLHKAQEYARPECHHCGDFSAELADISCGGVGAMDWTIVVLRTQLQAEGVDATRLDDLEREQTGELDRMREQGLAAPFPTQLTANEFKD